MKSTRPWPILLAHLAALLLLLPACGDASRPGPGGGGEPEPEEVSADFERQDVFTIDPLERQEAVQKVLRQEAPKVIEMLNSLYDAAFVDPELWEDGAHPAMFEYFSDESRGQAQQDIESLALGAVAADLERVEPTQQEAERITLYVLEDLGTPIGLVTVHFEATGIPEDEDQPPVEIVHDAAYWLSFLDGYKITDYSVDLQIGPGAADSGEEEE